MKKISLVLIFLFFVQLKSASIDYLIMNSTSYLGNPSQTANISVEGAFYNPAGLTKLDNGAFINVNSYFTVLEESMTLNNVKYEAKSYPLTPSVNFVYKNDKHAFYFNTSVIGGGATLKYNKGVAGLALGAEAINKFDPYKDTSLALNVKYLDGNFKGENRYYQGVVGTTYQLNDKFSFSVGGKYVYAIRKLSGETNYYYNESSPLASLVSGTHLSIDGKRKAQGVGGVLGLNINVTENTLISVKYDTPVKLNFKASTSESERIHLNFINKSVGISEYYTVFKDGVEERRDLPGVLSLGISQKIDKLTLLFGYNSYFNKGTKMDNTNYNNGNEFNMGVIYEINDKWSWTAGINVADTGAGRSTFTDLEYALNSQTYGTGVIFRPDENNEINFSMAYIHFDGENGENRTFKDDITFEKAKVKYRTSAFSFGVGYTYKF